MIQVTTGYPYRTYDVDADDAAMVAGDEERGETLLVLTKGDIEVAWFANWSNAVRPSNLKGTRDLLPEPATPVAVPTDKGDLNAI